MSNASCQIMETVEDLCKRCFFLQKSNNELCDFAKTDAELNEVIEENEKILVKYHRQIDEFIEFIKENSEGRSTVELSPVAEDFRRREQEQRRSFLEKRQTNEQRTDEQGMFL